MRTGSDAGDPYITQAMYETRSTYSGFSISVGPVSMRKIWKSAEAIAHLAGWWPFRFSKTVEVKIGQLEHSTGLSPIVMDYLQLTVIPTFPDRHWLGH